MLPLAASLALCALAGDDAAEPRAAPLRLVLDGAARGLPFEGIGALSAGADAALLFDYPPAERERLLDLLFTPRLPGGAALQILKVEIGGDVQSTSGVESSHTHFPGDLSYRRGYEYKLMVAARRRNPSIKIYALQWSVPGYIGGEGTGGNGHNASLDFSEANINYTLSWLRGARDFHKAPVDFLGFWNEAGLAPVAYVKAMRRALDAAGFERCKLIAGDTGAGFAKTYVRCGHFLDLRRQR